MQILKLWERQAQMGMSFAVSLVLRSKDQLFLQV